MHQLPGSLGASLKSISALYHSNVFAFQAHILTQFREAADKHASLGTLRTIVPDRKQSASKSHWHVPFTATEMCKNTKKGFSTQSKYSRMDVALFDGDQECCGTEMHPE